MVVVGWWKWGKRWLLSAVSGGGGEEYGCGQVVEVGRKVAAARAGGEVREEEGCGWVVEVGKKMAATQGHWQK